MAIFNEAYINEFFGIGKKKDTKSKKHGIITKEEVSKCKSIIKEACSKNKILEDYLGFENGKEYNKYLKSSSDSLCIGWIFHYSGNKIWDDSDEGEKDRKNKNLKVDFDEFMDWYSDQLEEICKNISKEISRQFDDTIKFDYSEAEGDYDYFYIESKKYKEGDN